MEEITIKTAASKSKVICGEGAFERFAKDYGELSDRIFLVTDSNVARIYEELIAKNFSRSERYVIPAGEKNKNYKTLIGILQAMTDRGMTRASVVVAFGGGVVGDIAGLAASLYMRGVRLVQIPTTLLAQVDSSVGGKTAIDMGAVKNVVGTFYQPERVYVDQMFLETLPAREIKCGLGEIVKYGAICDPIYRSLVLNAKHLKDGAYLKKITFPCIKYKAKVVAKDEKEVTGERKVLNMGHTTGHAFELYYKRKSHGEYVLIGMYYELYIAEKLGVCKNKAYADTLRSFIKKVIPSVPAYDDIEESAAIATHDKKNETRGEVSLIVPESEGKCREIKLSKDEYISLIAECRDYLAERGNASKGVKNTVRRQTQE